MNLPTVGVIEQSLHPPMPAKVGPLPRRTPSGHSTALFRAAMQAPAAKRLLCLHPLPSTMARVTIIGLAANSILSRAGAFWPES